MHRSSSFNVVAEHPEEIQVLSVCGVIKERAFCFVSNIVIVAYNWFDNKDSM